MDCVGSDPFHGSPAQDVRKEARRPTLRSQLWSKMKLLKYCRSSTVGRGGQTSSEAGAHSEELCARRQEERKFSSAGDAREGGHRSRARTDHHEMRHQETFDSCCDGSAPEGMFVGLVLDVIRLMITSADANVVTTFLDALMHCELSKAKMSYNPEKFQEHVQEFVRCYGDQMSDDAAFELLSVDSPSSRAGARSPTKERKSRASTSEFASSDSIIPGVAVYDADEVSHANSSPKRRPNASGSVTARSPSKRSAGSKLSSPSMASKEEQPTIPMASRASLPDEALRVDAFDSTDPHARSSMPSRPPRTSTGVSFSSLMNPRATVGMYASEMTYDRTDEVPPKEREDLSYSPSRRRRRQRQNGTPALQTQNSGRPSKLLSESEQPGSKERPDKLEHVLQQYHRDRLFDMVKYLDKR